MPGVFLLLRNLFVNATRWVRRALLPGHSIDWVRIELKGELPERHARRRVPLLLRRFLPRREGLSFEELDEALCRIEQDRRVRGVVVVLRHLRLGWGRLVALRARLSALRAAGKELAVVLEDAGNAEYYVATAGSFVALSPAGHLWLTGLAASVRFYRDALEKLAARAEVVGAGRYKSAFDPFTRTNMSEAHREALDAILDDLSAELARAIAEGRRMDEATVRRAIDDGPYTPSRAREAALVDAVAYADELETLLAEREKPGEGGRKVRIADLAVYRRASVPAYDWKPLWRRRAIAYVDVTGIIHAGESRRLPRRGATAGHESVCRALEAAGRDRKVVAVVLRVDSRGGSGLASDLIWRAVRCLGEKKPVVAYLSDVAASGGYYVACAANHIVASAGTLTGSIGVLAGKLDLGGLLARLGVRTEVLKRGALADVLSVARGFTATERGRLERDVRAFYDDFVTKVAESRKLSRDRVAEAAEGRVWTGMRALSLGLVDELGTFALAVQRARERAGLPRGRPVPLVTFGQEPALAALPDGDPWMPGIAAEAIAGWAELEAIADEPVLCWWPWDVRVG